MGERFQRNSMKAVAYVVLIFCLLPIFMLFVGAFTEGKVIVFPPKRLGFSHFIEFIKSTEYRNSIYISLMVAVNAVIIGLVSGVPTALALKRYNFIGKVGINWLVMSSMSLPRVIWAIGLLQWLSYLGVIGGFWSIVLAHSLIVMPYIVRMVVSSLSFIGPDIENAAQSLGASKARTFFEITVPLIYPGVIVGAFFGFVVSFTDTIVTVFICGTKYITYPVRIYAQQANTGLSPMVVAGSVIVIAVIILAQLIMEKFFNWVKYV